MEFEEQLERERHREQEECRVRFGTGVAALTPLFATACRVQSALFLPLPQSLHPIASWGEFRCYAMGQESGREQAPGFAARLGRLVLKADSYQVAGRGMKLCTFIPTVGFRVWGNGGSADIVLYFGCSELMVLESDPSVSMHTIGGQEGRFRVCGDFDPVAEPLATLAREALPEWERSPLWRGRQ